MNFQPPCPPFPEKADSKGQHEVEACAHNRAHSHLLWPGTLHLPVSGPPTSPVSSGTGPPGTEGGTLSANLPKQPKSGILGEFKRSHVEWGGQAQ